MTKPPELMDYFVTGYAADLSRAEAERLQAEDAYYRCLRAHAVEMYKMLEKFVIGVRPEHVPFGLLDEARALLAKLGDRP